jgi:hypothetical protein
MVKKRKKKEKKKEKKLLPNFFFIVLPPSVFFFFGKKKILSCVFLMEKIHSSIKIKDICSSQVLFSNRKREKKNVQE